MAQANLEMVQDILKDSLDIEPEQVTMDSTFESLGIDSLDELELICELEERCDIDFGEPEDLHTVADLLNYVSTL